MDLKRYIGKRKTLEQDIVRMLLILNHFGEIDEDVNEELRLVLRTEYYIQKLDFLLRNPDYLCCELLTEIDGNRIATKEKKEHVKRIIKFIFDSREPVLRRIPMDRFFYGAYESLDEVESFLTAIDFLRVRPQGTADHVQIKNYYLTQKGYLYVNEELSQVQEVDWYNKRCKVIKQYLGHVKASDLKSRQYSHESYNQARWGSTIPTVIDIVKERYLQLFGEALT